VTYNTEEKRAMVAATDRITMNLEEEATVDVRPTLIIGLGGTGHEVLVRLKAKLLDVFGKDIFEVVRLLCFDTADESLQASTSKGETVTLEEHELISISNVPVPGILANKNQWSTIHSWIPTNLPVTAVTAGARMVRALGRVSFFFHYGIIKSRIEKAIEDVKKIGIVGRIRSSNVVVSESPVMNVFIVCSVSGGTGGGTFIDAAYLAHKLCKSKGIENAFLTGILVLPEVFSSVRDERIRANAFAALRELDHYMTNGDLSVEYEKGKPLGRLGKTLFSICYLVDAVNEDGRRLSGIPQLAPMIAEAIRQQIASQVGKANDSRFDNVASLHVPDETGAMGHYSGVGIASISFPAKQIIDVCANRLGAELISMQFLAQHADEEQLDALLRDFVASNQLERDPLLLELSRNPTNRQALTVQLQDLSNIRLEDLLSQVQAYMNRVENQDLNTGYKLALDNNRKQLSKQLTTALDETISRILNDPDLGIHAAQEFIDRLAKRIEDMTSTLNQEVRGRTDRYTSLSRQVAPSLKGLEDAIGSFAIGRAGRVKDARQEYFRLQQERFQAQFDANKRNMAIALLADIGVSLSEQKRRVDTLEDKLNITKVQFQSAIADINVTRDRSISPLSYDVVKPGDVETYYREFVHNLSENRTQLVERNGGLGNWLNRSQDEISRAILGYGYQVFEPIRSKKIEEVIIARQRDRSPQARLHDLRRDSVPFWNYDRSLLPGGGRDMSRIVSIGVQDKDTSIFRNENLQDEEITSTQDPHSVTVLSTKHGLPLYTLQQYEEYRQIFRRHIQQKNASPVQIFDVNISDDEGEREARQTFALAEAFGLITSTGANIYRCLRADELSPQVELGRGLEASIQSFASQTELVREVQGMIDKQMNNIGRQESIRVINAYASPGAPIVNPSPRELVVNELKKLARDFVEDLKK
jgi:hypothetical protein